MAALEIPWLDSMSKSSTYTASNQPDSSLYNYDPKPPTVAAFAPTNISGYSASTKQRSTVIVHKKSPLLVATPPQVTRALAHSHPFILPLNKVVGLLSWSTSDPWESFLLVAAFWGTCLYGRQIVRYATPLNAVVFLIALMYSRRYSPLSSTLKTGEKHSKSHKRTTSTASQHKSLDEIVDTLQQFTTRCNILLDPFITMTDFLSTQQTATSATTKPALTTLFFRILLVSPIWIVLAVWPFNILTPRRTILSVGTIILTWHSRPARVTRVILWRSVWVRKISAFVTGLHFGDTTPADALLRLRPQSSLYTSATKLAQGKHSSLNTAGVRFTFILYENQRRWLALGWTTSLFAYERAPWTDENLSPAPNKDDFELPVVEGGLARWRWVDEQTWQIENGSLSPSSSKSNKSSASSVKSNKGDGKDNDGGGWVYYDNKWADGKLQDGWGRYTRRRKWFRDAELVEMNPSEDDSETEGEREKIRKAKEYGQSLTVATGDEFRTGDSVATLTPRTPIKSTATGREDDTASTKSTKRRSGWFKRSHSHSESKDSTTESEKVEKSSTKSTLSAQSRDGPENDVFDEWRDTSNRNRTLGVGEDVMMGFG